ncbi:polyprotein [Longquan Niviventer fulvescens pegivirus 1]|nr:polyprotein [Longquan Niviventer fulvescens pegivirus 1]
MQLLLSFLVLGTVGVLAGSSSSISPTTPTSTTPPPWEDFRLGWRAFGLSLGQHIQKGLRDAIAVLGPTVPSSSDWGEPNFKRWSGGAKRYFGSVGSKIKTPFTNLTNIFKRGLVKVGLGMAKAGGVDAYAVVAQQAAASMALRVARPTPAAGLDWRWGAGATIVLSFLCGVGLACLCRARPSWFTRGRAAWPPRGGVRGDARVPIWAIAVACVVCLGGATGSDVRVDSHLQSSRACYHPPLRLLFGNCCNESDVIWCTDWLCWTAPGCAVCTVESGCWTSIGAGVSVRPTANTAEAKRLAMELFGGIGWASVLAEGLGLGEVYAAGLASGVLLFGRAVPNGLACNYTCSQAAVTWWYQTAPTLATIMDFVRTLPVAVWNLLEAMPLLFGAYLMFMLACGRWVQVLLLVLSVPGCLATTAESPCDGDDTTVTPCTDDMFAGNNTVCDCPFGLIVRRFNSTEYPELDFNATCPETFRNSRTNDWYWTCGWGSWWWQHNNIERPYSHPYMPPSPFSAICYVTKNTSVLYNKTFFVERFSGRDSLGDPPVSTCMLDRRPAFCGGCRGGCFYEDGRHDRGFGVCGGGVRDGPWWFVPLATLRFGEYFRPDQSWVLPSRSMGELLASKYSEGYGCGVTSGLINCWWCNASATYYGNGQVPPSLWWPLPGEPAKLCINPQFRRTKLPTPSNWLAALQEVADALAGRTRCEFEEGWFPVCRHSAWYPSDGGFVVMAGDSQVIGGGPTVLKSFLGIYVALMVFMATSGARVVPALLVVLGLAHVCFSDCYLPCERVVCNLYACWSDSPCAVWVRGRLCLPAPNSTLLWCGAGSELSAAAESALLPCFVVWSVARLGDLPSPAAAWFTWQALRPVDAVHYQRVVCGRPWVAPSYQLDCWNLFLSITSLLVLPPWRLASVLLSLVGSVRRRAHYPWRWLLLALQLAMGGSSSVLLILALAWWMWSSLPGVEAALARAPVAAPALGWALRLPTWTEAILACVCVLLYYRCAGRARLAALAAWKVSRGLGGFLVLALLFHRGPDRGVLGAELCFPLFEADWTVDDAWWFASLCFSASLFLLALYTPLGRRAKLRAYAKWCRVYCWLEFALGVSPVGVHFPYLGGVGLCWVLAGAVFPREATWVCVALVLAAGSLDLLDWLLEVCLTAGPRANLLVGLANTCHGWLSDDELKAFLRRRWARGELLYDHAGQVSGSLRDRAVRLGLTLEPLAVTREELREVHDDQFLLTCGRWYGDRPVVARCGASVLVGHARSVDSLPPGYTLTAPFVVVRRDIGWLSILKVSMTGRSSPPAPGQIASLRTALGTSMGCAVSGVLYATFHGTKGRALATPHGPRNPFWSSPSEDVVCYPLPHPLTSLEPCGCNSASRWVLTRAGSLVHGVAHGENRVQLDCPTPISKLKGASGTPVLCDCGHAVGMMVGASGRSGVGESVRFVVPWKVQPGDVKPAALPEYPTVPATGYKEVPYIAPTGSGKSTKFPAKLAQDGHNVLVLNPSVVTTKAMHGYMKELTGKAPNVFAGTGRSAMQIKTGSKITYATYGRFLVNPQGFLQGKDVVVCDECHATDGTTILGTGCVRSYAESSGVRLVVFATATPPGTQLTPHANITEHALEGDGDVPFYGVTLKSELYLKGRHLIFCHSKTECQRVAEELASRGVHTVTYWRGKSQDVLTPDPDLTVVATDAISTGYTGNFATVTDCCSVVQEEVDIDLNPTFTVGVCTGPADAALRMQRRGRCGRGSPGTYYYTVKGAPPSGVCSSAAAWSAAEAAYMWYGMDQESATRHLVKYQECPYTSRLQGNPGDAVRVLGVLRPYFHCSEVTQEALRETQWPMLTGIQRHVCFEADAAAPSDDVRWQGVHGTGATPLLYRLGPVTAPTVSHPLTLKMAAALGDTSYHDTTLGPVLLARAAIAAACAVADATGVLVLAGSWEVGKGGAPVHPDAGRVEQRGEVAGSEPIPQEALQEVVTSLDWTWLTTIWGAMASGGTQVVEGAASAAHCARDWWNQSGYHLVRNIPTSTPGARVLAFLEQNLTALLAGGMALGSASSCPPFAALSAVVCGAAAAMPAKVTWMVTLAATAAASMVGGPLSGLGVGAGFWLGSAVGGLSVVDSIIGLAAGYEACVSTCAFVLDILDGRAVWSNAIPCLTGLLCPGSAIAGVVMALILRSAKAGDVTTWMNRLLSMLPRSNTLPDGFFAEKKDVKLGDAVRSLSLVQRVRAVCEATKEPEYVYTSATWVGRLIEFAGVVVRMVLDLAGSWLPNPLPKFPIYACQPPYRGKWHGEGTAVTRCTCGREVTLTARGGGAPVVRASSFCSSSWGDPKGFPINTTTKYSGTLMPDLSNSDDVSLMVGAGHVVRVRQVDGDWFLVETTLHTLTSVLVIAAAARGPVESRGKLVSNRIGTLGGGRFTEGQTITYDGTLVTLPHRLKFKITYPNLPFVPSLLPDNSVDNGEAIIGPCERAVEAALQVAEEATQVADAVSSQATAVISKAYEARRRAELAEWTAREKSLGKVLGRNMVAQYAVKEGALDPKVLEWLDSQPDAVGPPEDAAEVKVKLEDTKLAPVPLTEEGLLDNVHPPEAGEETKAIAEAAKGLAGSVGAVVLGGLTTAARGLVSGATSAVGAASAVAAKIRTTAAPLVQEAVAEVVPSPLSGPTVEAEFTWFCEGHRQVNRCIVPEETTIEAAARDAGVPWGHPHVYRWGGVPVSMGVSLKEMGQSEYRFVAACPGTKVKTVMRKVLHRCCGADASVTKHFRRDIPVSVVKSLFPGPRAVVMCETVELTGDEHIGDVGAVLEVVHDEPCGQSYLWSGRPIQVDSPRAAPISRPLTAQLRARADRVYVTNPQDVHQRIAKVTIEQRVALEDRYFRDAYNLALAKANKVLSRGYTYEEAVSKVRPGSAKGHVAKISVSDLKTEKGREEVLKCLNSIADGTVQAHFMLRPKAEVFPQTKATFKPPRLIVYPSLEFRVAEKMILGDPAVVAKAVMGKSYGFQYAPHERARVLAEMWASKKVPTAYTVDGTCFDSTVTPEDIRREGEIFAKASPEPGLVRLLHEHYASSPMVDPSGNIVGIRRCRASGTLTTSAGNSITCYLKVTAACRKAGLVDPSFLIHGDDVLIVCEKTEEDQSPQLQEALATYGYDCVPTRHADLTTAESCSASLDTVRTVRGVKHVLRCDMRRGLGRTMGEYGDPVGTAWGYCLNYPTHPACMYILLPLLLQTALNKGTGVNQFVTVDVRGNSLELPLNKFGAACRGLHGPDVLAVTGHSATVLQETFDCLQFFGMRGLNHWRRFRRKVKVRLIRAGREWGALARELLWDPGDVVPPCLRVDRYEIPGDLWEHSWEGLRLTLESRRHYGWVGPLALVALGLLFLVV